METQSTFFVPGKFFRRFVGVPILLAAGLIVTAGGTPAVAATDYAAQVTHSRLFVEPLVWVGAQPPPDTESQELLGDVGVFKSNGVEAGFAALEHFLAEHPQSAWAPVLEANMATYYRRQGHYTLALSHWEAAWNATKNSKDAAGQKIAVQAIAGWTRLLASLGEKQKLTALFSELQELHLPLGGYATTIEETKEGLATMNMRPGHSYRCGSYALGHLAMKLNLDQTTISRLFGTDSPDGGFTMAELLALAKTNGLAVEAVRQPAGAELVVPCVVHWKLNHFAAIVEKQGDRYRVEDPTFDGHVWMDAATIEAEASGDYILPKDKVPASWKKLSAVACAKIYGKGVDSIFIDSLDFLFLPCLFDEFDSDSEPPSANDGAGGSGDNPPSGNSGCPFGMPQWSVSEPFITLWLTDTPLLYHRSDGNQVQLTLTYKHRGEDANNDIAGFGNKWGCNWLGYLEADPDSDTVIDHLAGGGEVVFNTNGVLDYKTARSFSVGFVEGTDPPLLTSSTGAVNAYGYTNSYGDGTADYLLTERLDRYHRVLQQFNYQTISGVVRLVSMVDLDGRTNTLGYGNGTYSNLITAVTNAYGQTAFFNYDTNGLLTNIVDAQGMSSYFQYDTNEYITNMITPYGTNRYQYFDDLDTNLLNNPPDRAVLITEANGEHQLYEHPAYSLDPTIAGDDLQYQMSYHWNRSQFQALSTEAQTNAFALTTNDDVMASAKAWQDSGMSNSSGYLDNTLFWSADPVDPSLNGRPNKIIYYFAASLQRVTSIDPTYSGSEIDIYRNNLGRPTNYIYYSSYDIYGYGPYSTGISASYTNYFDSSGTILQYEMGPRGELTRGYGYDPVFTNLLTSVTNAAGDVIRYTHDTNTLKVTSIIFPTGLVRTNIYYTSGPSQGFLEIQSDIGVRTNSFAWQNGNLAVQTNELGMVTTYTYDNLNRLTSIGYPDSTVTSNIYNNLDIVATKDRLNQWTHYSYNAVRQLVAVTNADNQVTAYDYCGCGAPDEIIQSTGGTNLITQFSYNMGGLLTNAIYPDGYQLSYTYDLDDHVHTITDGDANQLQLSYYAVGLQKTVDYATLNGQVLLYRQFDEYGRAISSQDRNYVTVTNGYDFLNRLVARQTLGSGSSQSGLESFTYDSRGLEQYIDQLGHTNNFGRDTAWRVLYQTNSNQEVLQFAYNPADELLTLTDGKSQTTTWKYDSFGRVTNKLDANNTNLFVYQYDADDRLTNRWSAAKATTVYRYDPIGNLTNVDYSGGTVSTPSISFAYDGLNRLTNMLDGLGTTTFAWTSGNQLAGENGPWPNDAVTYTYDPNSHQRDSVNLSQPNASLWTQTYAYNSVMELANVTSPAGSFGYEYNGSEYDEVQKLHMPPDQDPYGGFYNEYYIQNIYDDMARLTNTTLTTPYWANQQRAYSYDAGSEVTQQVFTAGNFINYAYDNIGQLKGAHGFELGGTTNRLQEQFGYAYDAAGNLNVRTNNSLIHTVSVNNLNELTNVARTGSFTVAGTTTGPATNVTVNTSNAVLYADATFAATNFSLANGTNTFTAVAQDSYGRIDSNTVTAWLPRVARYVYDLNGNLLLEWDTTSTTTNRCFAYDDENQLTSAWVTNVWRNDFVYDGLLRKRVEKDYNWTGSAWQETNEVHFIYDGYLVIQERDTNNLPRVTYTWGLDLAGNEVPLLGDAVDGFQRAGGIGGLLARTDMGLWVANEPFASAYYFNDAQGNVVALVNTNGTMAAQYAYDPFGNTLSASGPLASANRYRFSSKEWNDNAGLYYYGFRFYDPNLQRWLNRDPIQEWGEINLFGFVFNDPINLLDPYGNCTLAAAISGATRAAAEAAAVATDVAEALEPLGWAALGVQAVLTLSAIPVHGALPVDPTAYNNQVNNQNAPPSSLTLAKGNNFRPSSKPNDAPPGTQPINSDPRTSGKVHPIKDGLKADGVGPDSWVGISPTGDVIVSNPDGSAENLGPYDSYCH